MPGSQNFWQRLSSSGRLKTSRLGTCMLCQFMSLQEISAQLWMIAPDANAPEHVCISSSILLLELLNNCEQLKLPLQGSTCKPDDSARNPVSRCAGCQAESPPEPGSPGHHWGHEGQEQAGMESSVLPCNQKQSSMFNVGFTVCHCSFHSLQTLKGKE